MASRFDKFSERARRVLTYAQEEAQQLNHNYIGTEHILLGMVREEDGVAARVLVNLDVNLAKLRSAVEFVIGRGEKPSAGETGLTSRAKKVIELAIDEARNLGHNYIGTEHLLLGLLREGEGVAAGVLDSFGISIDRVRAEITKVLAQGATSRGPATPAKPGKAQGKTPALDAVSVGPDRRCPGWQARPGRRPRQGDRAGHPDFIPPHQEQPGPHRRTRRRQDRHRRRAGASYHRLRRPRDARGQAARFSRHRLPRSRHQVPRRVRGAFEEDPRRAALRRQYRHLYR